MSNSFPIAKFSHYTGHVATRIFPYNHVASRERNDLRLQFHRTHVVDGSRGNLVEQLIMEITLGTELLESQDLCKLVTIAENWNMVGSTKTEPPIHLAFRSPLLAMRYPKGDNFVCRSQIKFHTESDFNGALGFITPLGLPVSESNAASQHKNRSLVSPAPSMPPPTSSYSGGYAVNSLRSPPTTTGLTNPTIIRSFNGGPLSSPISDLTPPSVLPYSTPFSIGRPPSTILVTNHLSKPSLYISQMERQAPLDNNGINHHSIFEGSNSSGRPTLFTSDASQLGRVFEGVKYLARSQSALPYVSQAAVDTEDPFGHASKNRPSSTPIDQMHNPRFVVPPKRVLPFPKSREKARATSFAEPTPLPKPTPVEKSDKPTAMEPAEKCQTPTHKPVKRKPTARKAPTSKAQKSVPIFEDPVIEKSIVGESNAGTDSASSLLNEAATVVMRRITDPILPPGTSRISKDTPQAEKASFSLAAIPNLVVKLAVPDVVRLPSTNLQKSVIEHEKTSSSVSKTTAVAKKRVTEPIRSLSANKRSKMVDQATQTQTLSGRDHAITIRSASRTRTPEVIHDLPTPRSPPEDYLNSIDNFISRHKSRPAPKELWESPRYSDADEEERDAILNDFICENLDNEDFLQLCRDTERSWRRIGLGL